MKLNKYPDGTSYINETTLSNKTFKVNTYEDLWHLNQFVDAFISEHNKYIDTPRIIPNILLPNLIDAQADKRFNKGESSGLKLVCKFLNSLEANFFIFHPHNAELVEGLLDNVQIFDNSKFINKVIKKLAFEHNSLALVDLLSEDLILMSTDAGGFKPLMKLADKIKWKGETESASKSRKYENGKSKLIQKIDRQDFEGKDILLIDDICVYGGTFKGLAKMLKERNCGKLYLAVSHLTIQSHKGGDDVFKYFDKVFTTNSKFDEYFIERESDWSENPKNLEIIKLFKYEN